MLGGRVLASGLEFPEGPVPLPDGSLLVCELLGGRLSRIDGDGAVSVVAELGGSPNGAAIGPDGAVYVCNSGGYPRAERDGLLLPSGPHGVTQPDDYSGGRIERVDLATGTSTVLYDGLRAPNDLVFDGTGGFWFTDHGKRRLRDEDRGVLCWARADGAERRDVELGLHGPNGVGLSPDGAWLYVAETPTARLYRWPVLGAGEVGPKALVAGVGGAKLFDSLAVEAGGNVCIGTLAEGGITVIDPADGSWEHLPVEGERLVTNIAFAGTTAYLTLSSTGRVLVCDWPRPGLPPAHR